MTLEELQQLITYHRYLYYNDVPIISDVEYDEVIKELRRLSLELQKKEPLPQTFTTT